MCKVLINIAVSFSLIFLITNTTEAQIPQVQKPGVIFGAYLIYAKPKGDFAKTYNFGGGGEVFGGVGISKTFIIATTGFSQFKAASDNHLGALNYTPFKIGVRQFILGKILFINADLGRATVKNKTFNETRFTRGFGFGAKLLGLQAALYYDGWKSKNAGGFSNSVNIKLGWGLSL